MVNWFQVTHWKTLHLPGNGRWRFNAASAIFLKCSGRYWLMHRWQAVLMLVGMALGVAVVFAVDIANESAKRAFSLSLDAVTGRATHQITGGAAGFDEQVYTRLRTEIGLHKSAPVIEGAVALVSGDQNTTETLQLLGVDLFAEPMFRNQLTGSNDQQESSGNSRSARSTLDLLTTGSVILGNATAERLGVAKGKNIAVDSIGPLRQLQLINTVNTDKQAAFDSIAMVDISTAQELLGFQGKLSRIDLALGEASGAAQIKLIEQTFPGLQVIESGRRNNALQQMTEAFHTNLLAMSLLALLVGAFLIYNTVTLSVLQRRSMFGQLRVAGVRRRELFTSILGETLVFAIVGTVAGLLLGLMLGNVLLTLVTRTINDLYFALDVRRLDFSLFTLLKAIAIGLGAALIAALAPAIEAANSAPVTVIQRSSVEQRASAVVPQLFIAGLVLLVIGGVILWITTQSLWAGFVALFCVVIGYSLLIPAVLIAVTRLATRLFVGLKTTASALGQYPLRSITASLSRTSVAIAALVVAVSATAGVGVMIGSFRLSVADWLGNTLQSDLYVRHAESAEIPLPRGIADQLSSLQGISGVRGLRLTNVDTNLTSAKLFAVKNSGESNRIYIFNQKINQPRIPNGVQPTSQQRWQQLTGTDSVYVSEPFAYSNQLKVDDVLNIRADSGIRPFQVAGIFADYNAGKGFIVMAMDTYHSYWNDREITSVGLTLQTESSIAATKKEVRRIINSHSDRLLMRSNAEIREMSLNIFDRTFAITHVLRLLTVGVAFVGILSALMALSLERRAEFAVLRALGITPVELRNLLFWQTGLMGIIAGLLALPLGVVMSKILVSVINLRSFGWTMEFFIPPMVLFESLLLAIIAALLAGWYPARKLSQMSPAEALRHR